MKILHVGLGLLLFSAIGCGGADNVFFTRTIVSLTGNGGMKVIQQQVSLQQQLDERAARESSVGVQQSALHAAYGGEDYDSCHNGISVHLWDNNGYGDELCVYTNSDGGDYFGYVDFAQICLDSTCQSSWWSRVKEYYVPNTWIPDEQGYFQTPGTPYSQSFFDCLNDSSQCGAHPADYTAQNSRYLFLDYNNLPPY